jgi:hypothetical protein
MTTTGLAHFVSSRLEPLMAVLVHFFVAARCWVETEKTICSDGLVSRGVTP